MLLGSGRYNPVSGSSKTSPHEETFSERSWRVFRYGPAAHSRGGKYGAFGPVAYDTAHQGARPRNISHDPKCASHLSIQDPTIGARIAAIRVSGRSFSVGDG